MFEKSRDNLTTSPDKHVSKCKKSAGLVFIVGLIAVGIISAAQFKDSKFVDDMTAIVEQTISPDKKDNKPPAPPLFSDSVVTDFVGESYTALMTVKQPVTLDAHMDKVRSYFTDKGFDSTKEAFKRGRLLDFGQDIGVAFREKPQIIHKDFLQGSWRWVVTFPIDLSFSTSQKSRVDSWNVTLVIQQKPDGKLGIAQTIAVPR